MLQAFGQLQVITEPAFAIQHTQQTCGLLRAERIDQGQRAAMCKLAAPIHRLLLPLPMPRAVGLQRRNALRIHTDQDRTQCGTQIALVTGLQQRLQQGVQLGCLAGGKHAKFTGCNRWNPGQYQRLLDTGGLGMHAHQHGDVAGCNALIFEHGLAVTGIAQYAVNGRHAGLRGLLS